MDGNYGKFLLMSCAVFAAICFNAIADDDAISHEIISKYQIIEELKKEIAQIDSENIRCEKMKKGWIAATIVGGVGVVATGTAAIIQGTKLKGKPKNQNKNKPDPTPETEEDEAK